MKSLAPDTAACTELHEIRVDDSASFATVDTQRCVYGGSFAQRGRFTHLASLCLGTLLAVTIGCARSQPAAVDVSRTENPRESAIDQMVDASVKVALDRDGRHVMFGSGVVVASHAAGTGTEAISYVLTAAHVVAAGDGATISVGFCGSRAASGKFAATGSAEVNPMAWTSRSCGFLALRSRPSFSSRTVSFASGSRYWCLDFPKDSDWGSLRASSANSPPLSFRVVFQPIGPSNGS